jgi:hypothetical protein
MNKFKTVYSIYCSYGTLLDIKLFPRQRIFTYNTRILHSEIKNTYNTRILLWDLYLYGCTMMPAVVSVLPRPPYGMLRLLTLDPSILVSFSPSFENILFRFCLRLLANISAHQIDSLDISALEAEYSIYWIIFVTVLLAKKCWDVPIIFPSPSLP